MGAALAPSDILQRRRGELWLVTDKADLFWSQLAQFQAHCQQNALHTVLLAESDPVKFLAAFLASCQHACRIWLANPQWGEREWAQVAAQCQPDWIIGTVPGWIVQEGAIAKTSSDDSPNSASSAQILIPTGGSSGNIRFALHTWKTLAASVQGFCQHFRCRTVNAYCVLPLYHVSGLMQAMRCWLTGGKLVVQPFQQLLRQGAISPIWEGAFLSLVPTQLQRLLASDRNFVSWLQTFQAILLGGAPANAALLQQARDLQLPLAPTYGMTETGSQVATLLPQEFLSGQTGSGRALPHACISICDKNGQPLSAGKVGQITIQAASLAHGFWQKPFELPFQSGDLGYLDEAGYLTVLGRAGRLIFTGGEKVLPEEVERAIAQTGYVQDVSVLGVEDETWGERVVAVVVPKLRPWSSDRIASILRNQLSPYKRPKQWFVLPKLPRNAQGKLNRAQLHEWVVTQMATTDVTTEPIPTSGDGADG